MIVRSSKVLLLAAIFVIAGIARADSRASNDLVISDVAISEMTALQLQVTQTGGRLLDQPVSKITLADLQSLTALTQKYFSLRKEIEEPIFRYRMYDTRNFGYRDGYKGSALSGQPSVEQTLIAAFQHYLSANHADSVSALIQFRNTLRPLTLMNEGRLSGSTWLYSSHLPPFADQNLQLLDKKIIKTSLASAAALRKKHQYASAIKTYKTLLTDYTNTPHEAPIKVLLDAAIVEDYNYRAKRALAKHDYKTARSALKKIIELYPETAYAKAAEKALLATVPQAVKFYAKQGKKYWKPGEEFLKPQTKSRQFYEKAYKENPDGPRSAEMLYHWAEGRASEKGKVPEAVALLELWLKKYPESHSMRQQAMYLLGFFYGSLAMREYQKSIDIMNKIVERWPNTPLAAECLWQIAFAHTGMADGRSEGYRKGEPYLMRYYKEYPEAPRWPNVVKWIKRFREYTVHPKQ